MADPTAPDGQRLPLCPSEALVDSGLGVPFDVLYGGQTCYAFAIRYQGQVYAYLNRCSHVAIELDYQPNRFFDSTGHWLICATHGAHYAPQSGRCSLGPCRGGLIPIATSEQDGQVFWHTAFNLKPVDF